VHDVEKDVDGRDKPGHDKEVAAFFSPTQKSKGGLKARRFEITYSGVGCPGEANAPPGLENYFFLDFLAFFAFFAFFAFLAIVYPLRV
jgi:hypothetical protein